MEGSNKEKWGGNGRKSFFSEMWGNSVRVLRVGGACEYPVGLSMCEAPIETVKYILVNDGACLIGFCHKIAEIHFLCTQLIN